MSKPIIHFEAEGDNVKYNGILELRGSYREILAMMGVITKNLCLKGLLPEDILLAVANGIKEARK